MSASLIAIVGCIYLYVAGAQLAAGNVGMSIMYAGYALGNVGAWMLVR